MGAGENPEVAVGDGVAVVLECDGAGVGAFFLAGSGFVLQFNVALYGNAVQQDGEASVGGFFSGGVEAGGGEVDVVGLPGKGWEAHIQFRRTGAIEAATFVESTF